MQTFGADDRLTPSVRFPHRASPNAAGASAAMGHKIAGNAITVGSTASAKQSAMSEPCGPACHPGKKTCRAYPQRRDTGSDGMAVAAHGTV